MWQLNNMWLAGGVWNFWRDPTFAFSFRNLPYDSRVNFGMNMQQSSRLLVPHPQRLEILMLIPDSSLLTWGKMWDQHGKFQPQHPTFCRGLKFPFWSRIWPYWHKVKSEINMELFNPSRAGVGSFCVNPRFLPTDIGWNLGSTRKFPSSASPRFGVSVWECNV